MTRVPTQSRTTGKPVSDFGAWLLGEIERKGSNQRQFSIDAEISPQAISHWVFGERVPKIEQCDRMASALKVPLWRVLEAAGLPYEGMKGVPRTDVRRKLWARIERMSDEDAARLLESL